MPHQVREAFRAARARNTVGPILHKVFENALRVGKKVREDTGMDQGKLSVASVAVDVAREAPSIELVRFAPMGDPVEIKLRGYNLTLRKHEADHIFVRPGR